MTKRELLERIETLERRVRDLEERPNYPIVVQPEGGVVSRAETATMSVAAVGLIGIPWGMFLALVGYLVGYNALFVAGFALAIAAFPLFICGSVVASREGWIE